jgi:hypothetical protein
MTCMKRRLAEQQHQSPSLLEADIRGSRQQAISGAMGYFSQTVHRAWCDHHADGGEASRGDGSSDISASGYV